jgi:phosphohistidine swiveling domain-containing protein
LKDYKYENTLFEKHITKYEWINTEYVSGGWSRDQWLELFIKSINSEEPRVKLEELLDNFKQVNEKRDQVIKELNPPVDVQNALNALSVFISQRDWTKGYFTRILLSYNKLLSEIAHRLGVDKVSLLSYSYIELREAVENMKALDSSEIELRSKNGFAMIFKNDEMTLSATKEEIDQIIKKEKISDPFEEKEEVTEFKGMSASRGIVTGKARVLEDAQLINELEEGEILVTYMTTIEFIPGFRKAAAVVTDEGGMSCHAAIISREFGLPCVVGTQVATRVLKTGDLIEVNGDTGVIKILEKI